MFKTRHTHSSQQNLELDIQNMAGIRTSNTFKPVSYSHQSFLAPVWQLCFCFNETVKYRSRVVKYYLCSWQMRTLFNTQYPEQSVSCFKVIILNQWNNCVHVIRSLKLKMHRNAILVTFWPQLNSETGNVYVSSGNAPNVTSGFR